MGLIPTCEFPRKQPLFDFGDSRFSVCIFFHSRIPRTTPRNPLQQQAPTAVHFDIVANSTHHPPTYATKPNKCRHPLTHEYDHYRFIMLPPNPFQGGSSSVANNSARSTPARQSATNNADTYYLTLHYNQVRLIMPPPPFEGGGGNHYTSTHID